MPTPVRFGLAQSQGYPGVAWGPAAALPFQPNTVVPQGPYFQGAAALALQPGSLLTSGIIANDNAAPGNGDAFHPAESPAVPRSESDLNVGETATIDSKTSLGVMSAVKLLGGGVLGGTLMSLILRRPYIATMKDAPPDFRMGTYLANLIKAPIKSGALSNLAKLRPGNVPLYIGMAIAESFLTRWAYNSQSSTAVGLRDKLSHLFGHSRETTFASLPETDRNDLLMPLSALASGLCSMVMATLNMFALKPMNTTGLDRDPMKFSALKVDLKAIRNTAERMSWPMLQRMSDKIFSFIKYNKLSHTLQHRPSVTIPAMFVIGSLYGLAEGLFINKILDRKEEKAAQQMV